MRLKFPLTILFCAVVCVCAAPVEVRLESITLPTYNENPPDVLPSFDGDYPYASRNAITQERNNESWRVIVLENEFLRCRILPDLAGRLYGCTDKRTGREMFFANPSIRKAPNGLRGAWIAAGVEPNFPVGHTRDAVSPVDFAFRRNDDGSASVVTGSIDRVTGMTWQTEFILRPGETSLEERVTLSNPTAVPHRYYWWNDAGIGWRDPGARFILPTHLVAAHERAAIDTWPVDSKGTDISLVANSTPQMAWFSYGSKETFEAIYEPRSRAATVHVAGAELTGQKIYAWGHEQDEWVRRALTDDGSTYIEIQAGLFENQSTFRMFGPQQTRSFTEYWLPVHDLGGISRAVSDAVLSLRPAGNALTVEVEATRRLPHAHMTVTQAGRTLLDETDDLDPAHAWSRNVAGYAPGAECRFELRDGAGRVVLSHALSAAGKDVYDALTPDRVTLGPQKKPGLPFLKTADDFLHAGVEEELKGNLPKALAYYKRGLSAFPSSVPLHVAAGRLHATLLRWADAEHDLSGVVQQAPDNVEAQYYLGLALAGQGNDSSAEAHFQAALRSNVLATAAAMQLGGLFARRGDLAGAAREFHAVLEKDPDNVHAGVLEIAVLRKQHSDAATTTLRDFLARAPQNSMLRVEAIELGASDDSLWQHLGANPERVLDIAGQYLFAGFSDEALALLTREYPPSLPNQTELASALPQKNPLVAYYRAYCRSRMGQPFAGDLETARSLLPMYVYPYRASDLTVLEWAVKTQPNDPTAHMLLGYLYRSEDARDRAMEEWHRAETLRPGLPGVAPLIAREDLAQVRTIAVEPDQPLQTAGGKPAPQLSARVLNPGSPGSPLAGPHAIAVSALMRSLNALNSALGVFNETNFPGEKQDDFVRRVWLELRLQRVRSMAAGGDCTATLAALDAMGDEVPAVPFTIRGFGSLLKDPRVQFYEAEIENRCGREKVARKRLERLARMDSADGDVFPILAAIYLHDPDARDSAAAAAERPAATGAQLYSRGMLLDSLGRKGEAGRVFEQGANSPGDDFARYLNLRALNELH